MRYPVGYRMTFIEAMNAARYAAKLTGMRYQVYVTTPYRGRKFVYGPAQQPPPEPFTQPMEL